MTARHSRPDVIDRAAGLKPSDPVYDLRADRPQFVEGARACTVAVLSPQDELGLEIDLRLAVARRVVIRFSDNQGLLAEYPMPTEPGLRALSEGEMPGDPRLRAIARHADLIALSPGAAQRTDLDALSEAGLSTPEIVALSQLLAFVCFQAQVVRGLSLLTEEPQ